MSPNASLQETIGNLILQGLADSPEREAIRQASLRAFTEVRAYVWREFAQAMKTVGQALDLGPVVGDHFGPSFGNTMVPEEEIDPDGRS